MALTPQQREELNDARSLQYQTKRASVTALEDILYQPFEVLDHGLIRVIDYMGDDSAIVQAARVSYGKGTKKVQQDQGLINYLMRHRHTTPFEMCEIKFHVKLPIFVAREWIRHRTANVNEYSGRYSIIGKEFYIPTVENLGAQSTSNRQGRGQNLSPEESAEVLQILRNDAEQSYAHYEQMMNTAEDGTVIDANKAGLARELARMNLTLNYYTEWYWKIDLHNLLHFISLRADPYAQYEIRVYAEIMMAIVERWLPLTFTAFKNYRLNAAHFSEQGLAVIKRMIQGEQVTADNCGMTGREWSELSTSLGLNNS